MPSLWTEDPLLAQLYDIECAGRHDHDFYLELATEKGAATVVDLGCGTGVFATDLVARGHTAVGVDPAAAMLDIARSRPGGAAVTWIHGIAADVPARAADLVVMMGHVAQYFLDDADWASTLRDVHRILRPGGHVTFEARNPAVDWSTRWTKDRTTTVFPHPDGGEFTSWVEVTNKQGPADSYRATHVGHTILPSGRHLAAEETLRFRNTTEITDSLVDAGFSVEKTWGDWDRSPHTHETAELIVLAAAR